MIKLNPNNQNYIDKLYGLYGKIFQSARHGDPHVHQIERVYPHHEGVYTCVVGNGEKKQ